MLPHIAARYPLEPLVSVLARGSAGYFGQASETQFEVAVAVGQLPAERKRRKRHPSTITTPGRPRCAGRAVNAARTTSPALSEAMDHGDENSRRTAQKGRRWRRPVRAARKLPSGSNPNGYLMLAPEWLPSCNPPASVPGGHGLHWPCPCPCLKLPCQGRTVPVLPSLLPAINSSPFLYHRGPSSLTLLFLFTARLHFPSHTRYRLSRHHFLLYQLQSLFQDRSTLPQN